MQARIQALIMYRRNAIWALESHKVFHDIDRVGKEYVVSSIENQMFYFFSLLWLL